MNIPGTILSNKHAQNHHPVVKYSKFPLCFLIRQNSNRPVFNCKKSKHEVYLLTNVGEVFEAGQFYHLVKTRRSVVDRTVSFDRFVRLGGRRIDRDAAVQTRIPASAFTLVEVLLTSRSHASGTLRLTVFTKAARQQTAREMIEGPPQRCAWRLLWACLVTVNSCPTRSISM